MGTITSGIGLASGLPTADLIDQLMALEQRPLTLLENRQSIAEAQRTALLDLTGKVVALDLSASRLADQTLYNTRKVLSSNPDVLNVVADAGAALGTFQFRPVSLVQNHQMLSSGVADRASTLLGAGTLRISQGGFVDDGTSLDLLNGGQGARRGTIRITDRSGFSADIDLSTAITVQDVLDQINWDPNLGVVASVSDRHLVLTDVTGQAASNLVVQDLGGGGAAADLGITGNVASGTLTGSDVLRLDGGLSVDVLNDGNGVRVTEFVDDFRITLKDGSTIDVSLDGISTIDSVLNRINTDAENSGNLQAALSADGTRLVLTDTSGGGGTLTVASLGASQAAADLGILGTEQGGGVLQGHRVVSGLNTALLRSLNGGTGIGTPGQVSLTDRSGAGATIDLTSAETLQDVIEAVNSAGIGITASVNEARNGIVLSDTTGGGGNLVVADVGGSTVASDLGIVVNAAVDSVDSGDRNLQYISESTALDTFGSSDGVSLGEFKITDSAGGSAVIDLALVNAKTLGDVVDAINATAVGVTAGINATGDGLLLTDTAGGAGTLTVEEVNGGKTAAELHILGSDDDGDGMIDGALETLITVDATDTLDSLVAKIQASGAPVQADILSDGSSVNPHRLILASDDAGRRGELLVDASDLGLSFTTTVRAEDSLLVFGGGQPGSQQVLLRSSDGTFEDVLPGVTVEVLGTSPQPVSVSISEDAATIVDALQTFVDDYNGLVDRIDELTRFDTETEERGLLQGEGVVLQIQSSFDRLAFGSLSGLQGSITSLTQLGVSSSDGRLELDESVLLERLEEDANAVRDFFLEETNGFAERLESMVDLFTDPSNGILTQQTESLDQNVADLASRIENMQEILDLRRTRLLNEFAALEQILSQFQQQQTALAQIQGLVPLQGGSSSASGQQ